MTATTELFGLRPRLPEHRAVFDVLDDGSSNRSLAPFTRRADCYSCQQANGAVDTTFVQFYPTLMPIAREKKTLSAGYLTGEAKR